MKRIISGGQTGADIAGVKWAKANGLETGGWMPYGFRTDDGKRPEYAELYGMRQHPDWRYPPRTELNVKESDGTVIFGNHKSPGSVLTFNLCRKHERPCLIVPYPGTPTDHVMNFGSWLRAWKIRTLNVAGNRESKNPGIERHVIGFFDLAAECALLSDK